MNSSFSSLFYRLLFVFVVVELCSPCDARRPRAYIHIGPHKAGSTTVQYVLAGLHDKLEPRIHSPLKQAKSLADFAKTVMKNGDLEPFRPLLYSISRKEKDIILSAEAFDKPKNISSTDKLAEIFKGYDVTIIAYLREPMAHLTSYWLQWNCGYIPPETLPGFLNTTLDNLRVLSSLPPPSEIPPPEVDRKNNRRKKEKKKMEKKEKEQEEVEVEEEIGEMTGVGKHIRVIEDEMEWLIEGGGTGWELFRTLDLYRHSFNVITKKEKEEGQRREEKGEGENKIVLIDFDGVLASGKTLAGVLLNEVVGFKGINTEDLHENSRNNRLVTTLNIWAFYPKDRREESSHRMPCDQVEDRTKTLRGKLEASGGLKACTEVIDLDKVKREVDDYFEKKLEESGLEVLYGGKGKEWTGFKDCYVVDEEVGKTVHWELDLLPEIHKPKKPLKKVREWRKELKPPNTKVQAKAMRKVAQKKQKRK